MSVESQVRILRRNEPDMPERHPRIAREKKTIAVMMDIYCRGQHGGRRLCAECAELLAYSVDRLEKCPFQEGKTTCARCPVHCFAPAMRDRIKVVMRYSGPLMLRRHPALAMRHLMDRARKEPVRDRRRLDRVSSA